MKVKGSAVTTLPLFIKETFGEEAFQKWLEALSPEAKDTYSVPILTTNWYPLKTILSEPTQKICELFYNGNIKGAWESGRFSAEHGLRGVYKVFIKFGSVHFLIKKASTILPSYYEPSSIEVIEFGDKKSIVHITKFEDADKTIDQRIGGWMERALEISGCKNVKVDITKSITKGDPITEFKLAWD